VPLAEDRPIFEYRPLGPHADCPAETVCRRRIESERATHRRTRANTFCGIKSAAYGECAIKGRRIVVHECTAALQVEQSCDGVVVDGVTDPTGRSCDDVGFKIQVSR